MSRPAEFHLRARPTQQSLASMPPRRQRTRSNQAPARSLTVVASTGSYLGSGIKSQDEHGRAASQATRFRSRRPSCRPPRRIRAGADHRRSVHTARGSRRGRDGQRLPGRADRTGQAASGAEADQGRHGFAERPGPVRRRAAGPRAHGPPQHRTRLRRRQHRGQPAVLRNGARQRSADEPRRTRLLSGRIQEGFHRVSRETGL